jgi:hypothetical protein
MALCLSQTVIGAERDFFSAAPPDDGGPSTASDCPQIPLVTQGRTLDEVTRNLREAVELHLEGHGGRAQEGLVVNWHLRNS